MSGDRDNALATHVAECGDCGTVPVEALRALLDGPAPHIDAADLSERTLARLAPLLQERSRALFWKRARVALAAGLLPLPLVVAADVWLLGWLYGLIAAWLPETVALYMVAVWAVWLVVLIASTYAAIPLLLARLLPPPEAEPAAA